MTDQVPIRPAATVILLRQMADGPAVLMGQRGATAAFMPSKFVFPGGAVDGADAGVALAAPLAARCAARLGPDASAIAAAAIRELWEETGLVLGRAFSQATSWAAPAPWQDFAARGMAPDPGALQFIFRAITPPGRPRRFDAHFFLADAAAVAGDPDDFSAASDELSLLQWVPLDRARSFDLPFITEVVLAEVGCQIRGAPPDAVPFFDNSGPVPTFRRIA